MPRLELFYFDSCPFCQFVLRIIKELDIKVSLRNIQTDPSNLQVLMQDTGRRTVPCLYIDGRPMFESQDIMNWLEKNAHALEKN